jgi:uncharacterized protein (TIGR00251 family)
MTRITTRVIPNTSRSEIVGREDGAWKIRLAAPPVDGKANDALIRFLADILDLAPSEIDIVKGHSSKTKILSVHMAEEDVATALKNATRSVA